MLTVLDDPHCGPGRKALVRCDCGTERWVIVANLRQGRTKSCGCNRRGPPLEIGSRYGRLIVLSNSFRAGNAWFVSCQCECGAVRRFLRKDVACGHSRSCGCAGSRARIAERSTTHGMHGTPTYSTWRSMLQRCYNPKEKAFREYGARGITVCERWRASFENFLADMGERPAGLTIDRDDVNGHYEPRNCRWATPTEQANNTRRNKLLTFGGRTQTQAEWAREIGISPGTLHARLAAGWLLQRALTQSLRPSGR